MKITIPLTKEKPEFSISICKKLILQEIKINRGDIRKMVIEVSCTGKDSTKKYFEIGKFLYFDNPYKDKIIKISASYKFDNEIEDNYDLEIIAELLLHP